MENASEEIMGEEFLRHSDSEAEVSIGKKLEVDALSIKALIVDDEEDLLELAKDHLEDAGINVLLARSADQASEILNINSDIDVVVCDLKMPKMRGDDLAKKIKEKSIGTKVILLTGALESEIRISDFDKINIFDQCIFKPFDLDFLVESIIKLTK